MRLQLNKLNILLVDFVLVVLLSDGSRTFHIDHNSRKGATLSLKILAYDIHSKLAYSILCRLPAHQENDKLFIRL